MTNHFTNSNDEDGPHAAEIAQQLADEFADYTQSDFDVSMWTSGPNTWEVRQLGVPDEMTPLSTSQKDTIESVIGWRP